MWFAFLSFHFSEMFVSFLCFLIFIVFIFSELVVLFFVFGFVRCFLVGFVCVSFLWDFLYVCFEMFLNSRIFHNIF